MINTKKKKKKREIICVVHMHEVRQNGKVFYCGNIPSDILDNLYFDRYNPKTGEGYNRDKIKERGTDFYNFIKKPGNICASSIVINDRDNSVGVKRNLKIGGVDITIYEDSKLCVTEGQGRTFGYRLYHNDGNSIDIPCVLLRCALSEEIYVARTINGTQKRMPSNINYCQSHQSVIDFLKNKIKLKDIDRPLLAQAICYKVLWELNRRNKSVFHKRFVLPNEALQSKQHRLKKKSGKTNNDRTISMGNHAHTGNLRAFVKEFLADNVSSYKDYDKLCDDIYKITDNFWKALHSVNPKIFEGTKTEYVNTHESNSKILIQGYHTQSINGCHVLYPLLRIMYRLGAKTKADFVAYFSKSKSMKSVEFWKDNRTKDKHMQIVSCKTWPIERKRLAKEMGISVKK
jgi:hypothetical protein